MNIFSTDYMLYADACLAYMVTAVVCAVIRWRHMCHPYDEQADYFYPARRQVTFFYAVNLMQFPYYLWPSDEGTWLYIRCFSIICIPVCFTMLFARYFKWQQLKQLKNILLLGLPMLTLACMMVAVMLHDASWFERHAAWLKYMFGGLGLLLAIRLAAILRWIKTGIDSFHRNNYAAEDDFPFHFAKRAIWTPLVWVAFSWTVFLSGSRDVKLALDIFLSIWMVRLLCHTLHPQRMLRTEVVEQEFDHDGEYQREKTDNSDIRKETDTDDTITPATPTSLYSEEAKAMVLAIILRKFREPHLLKTEVLADVDNGMTAQASRFIAEVGYYNLINMFRLRYATLYKQQHPQAKQVEVAEQSGYISDQALSRAKKNVTSIDMDMVKNVTIETE